MVCAVHDGQSGQTIGDALGQYSALKILKGIYRLPAIFVHLSNEVIFIHTL